MPGSLVEQNNRPIDDPKEKHMTDEQTKTNGTEPDALKQKLLSRAEANFNTAKSKYEQVANKKQMTEDALTSLKKTVETIHTSTKPEVSEELMEGLLDKVAKLINDEKTSQNKWRDQIGPSVTDEDHAEAEVIAGLKKNMNTYQAELTKLEEELEKPIIYTSVEQATREIETLRIDKVAQTKAFKKATLENNANDETLRKEKQYLSNLGGGPHMDTPIGQIILQTDKVTKLENTKSALEEARNDCERRVDMATFAYTKGLAAAKSKWPDFAPRTHE